MNKRLVALALISIIFLCSVSIQGGGAAQPANYIRVDGSIQGTSSIQRSGDVFTFSGNVVRPIIVERDNIVIDGAGYALQGSDGYGVVLAKRNNVTVKNTRITLDSGIIVDLSYAVNCIISGNSLLGVPLTTTSSDSPSPTNWIKPMAISFYGSNNNTIEENNISNCNPGLEMYTAYNNTITDNNVTNCTKGIELTNVHSNILRNNHVSNCSPGFAVSFFSINDCVNYVDTSNTVDGAPVYYWVGEHDKTVPSDAGYVVLVNCTRITVKNLNPQSVVMISTTNSVVTNLKISNKLGNGLDLQWCSNIRIVGTIIENCDIGINLYYSSDNAISNCTITNCTACGVCLSGSRNRFSENTFIGNGFAITPPEYGSAENTFIRNKFRGNDYALAVYEYNTVTDNEFTGNNHALTGLGGPVTIKGNTFKNNGQAISLFGADSILRNNRMQNNSLSLVVEDLITGNFGHVDTVHIVPNDIDASNTADGKPIIYWVNQHDKTVPLDAACVYLVSCSNIIVQNLNLTLNGQGIALMGTTGSTVKDNVIASNGCGVILFSSSQNTLSGNLIAKNGVGMRLGDATLNTIVNNSFTENGGFAIIFTGTQKDNIIHHNNFINNQVAPSLQVSIDKFNGPGWGNTWDDGEAGNYWSEYTTRYTQAKEVTGSGAGDTLFEINENNVDHHPFMNPIENIGNPELPILTPRSGPSDENFVNLTSAVLAVVAVVGVAAAIAGSLFLKRLRGRILLTKRT